ncbi:uncharacterized protein LOC129579606 [Sitodiplosis mosellana]|uniref:uncharacterized protein LOC129579606 n=1 Tax=Sitodiplosis mosellana TaxID=263140 RepID=UPI002443DE23|nr:uncharacterized protein LOC129579606 [Sitodiplosis mosellana]
MIDNLLENDFLIDVERICEDIEQFRNQRNIIDLDVLHDRFLLAHGVLSTINTTDQRQCLFDLISFVNQLEIGVSPNNLNDTMTHIQTFDFLLKIRNETIQTVPENSIKRIGKMKESLSSAQKWYNFLIKFHNELFRTTLPKDDLSKMQAQCRIEENDVKNIDDTDLEQVLTPINSYLYSEIRGLGLNSNELNALKRLLNISGETPDMKCSPNGEFIVRGYMVRASDVVDHSCWSNAKTIDIFALSAIIFDADINKMGEQVKLSIISPVWQILREHKIILDGKPGENMTDAQSGDQNNRPGNGEHGKAGNNGTPGGHFLGIGDEFNNGHLLSVHSNGADGGAGQNGGNGTDGVNGSDPPPWQGCHSLFTSFSTCEEEQWTDKGFKFTRKDHPGGLYGFFKKSEVKGKTGTQPGNGGNGGKPGIAGYSGIIKIFEIDVKSRVNISNRSANSGTAGKGGIGGKIAVNGRNMVCVYDPYREEERSYSEYTYTNPSTNGTDGLSDKGQKPQITIEFKQLWRIINKYKSYVREKLPTNIRERKLSTFLEKIAKNTQIVDEYKILGLIDELDGLEHQFFKLENHISLAPFYESLLHRISEHAINGPIKKEEKKILSYLYTAALSKIFGMKNRIGNNTVYDLDEFLGSVKESIEKLKEIESKVAIIEYRNQYESLLNKKMGSAHELIEKQIKPTIDGLFNEIDQHIDQMVHETIQKEQSAADDIIKYEKQKRDLEKAMAIRSTLAPFKIFSPLLSVFGPHGAIAGGLITSAASTIESLVIGTGDPSIGVISPLPVIRTSLTQLSAQLNNKAALFKAQIAEIDTRIKDYDNEGMQSTAMPSKSDYVKIKEKIKEKVKECKEFIKDMEDGSYNRRFTATIDQKKNELKDLLLEEKTVMEQRKAGLEARQPEMQRKIDKYVRFLGHAQTVASAGEMAVEVFNRYKSDANKLKVVSDSISVAKENLQKLKAVHNEISNNTMLQVELMDKKVNELYDKLTGKQRTELDMQKWEIQNFLRDLKLQFAKLMKFQFSIELDLQSCFTKIDEGINTLIDVYDHIESYVESKQLAQYIANIASPNAIEIRVEDPVFLDAITRLQHVIKSNLVLEKYNLAMRAVAQHYFPVVHLFVRNYDLPLSLKTNDTASLIENSIEKITSLQSTIKEKKILSNEYENVTFSDIGFDGELLPPFYIWKHHTIRNEIRNLFKGESIIIAADIMKGVDLNAVKFNEIQLRFKLQNETAQNRFNGRLNGFLINMTMIGNNNYRCNKRIYCIPLDRNVEIVHHFVNGQWVGPNDVHRKIADNEAFLSPYTTWMIQLSGGDFRKLDDFHKETIDLELIGRGKYLMHGTFSMHNCNDQLDKYYNFEKIISQ